MKNKRLRTDVVDFRNVRLTDYDILNILMLLKKEVNYLERSGAPKVILNNQIRLMKGFETLYKSTYNGKNEEALFQQWYREGF